MLYFSQLYGERGGGGGRGSAYLILEYSYLREQELIFDAIIFSLQIKR